MTAGMQGSAGPIELKLLRHSCLLTLRCFIGFPLAEQIETSWPAAAAHGMDCLGQHASHRSTLKVTLAGGDSHIPRQKWPPAVGAGPWQNVRRVPGMGYRHHPANGGAYHGRPGGKQRRPGDARWRNNL